MSLPAVPDADGRPLDRVALRGLVARGHHGVLAAERRDGQDFAVDVVLHLDTRPAAAGDDLAATVNYAELAGVLAAIVRGRPVNLIETLAARLAERCLEYPPVHAVDVTVHKPRAPIAEIFGDVSVTVRRHRGDGGEER